MDSYLKTYEYGLELLKYPISWCEAADILIEIGNRSAIIPIMRAYEMPVEVSKVCLLDAMDALDAVRAALIYFDSESIEEKRLAVHMMELFSNEVFLPALENAIHDPNPEIRSQARRSLACQMQTPAWEVIMIRLLDVEEEETRAQAIKSLARRRSGQARFALAERLQREPSPVLQKALREALPGAGESQG